MLSISHTLTDNKQMAAESATTQMMQPSLPTVLEVHSKVQSTPSWCLGCSDLYSVHTADSLHEALKKMVSKKWGLDLSKMAVITTDNAFNNKNSSENYNCLSCFGHKSFHGIHLAVGKALGLACVSSFLFRQLCLPFPGQTK